MFGQDLISASPGTRPSDAAAELAGVRAQIDAAATYSGDVVLFMGVDGTVHSASPACRRLFGVEPADSSVVTASI